METKDSLEVCRRCNGNACYKQVLTEEVTTYMCMGCGFTTSTLMKKGSELVSQAVSTSPELYKDLMFEDNEGYVWLPATITVPDLGIVFVDGTNKEDWRWAAAKVIPLSQEELASGRFPQGQTTKMDMKNSKRFDQRGFALAANFIGMF